MKKILLVIVAIPLLLGAMLVSLIVSINMQGGMPESKAWVGDIPVIGSYVKIRKKSDKADQTDQTTEAEANGGEREEDSPSDVSPMVMVASRERLAKLCKQVEAKLVRLEEKERQLQEKKWQLQSSRKELKKQRERLLNKASKREAKLNKMQEQIAKARKKLKGMRVKIKKTEKKNLQQTAAMFGRMETGAAAQIITRMYEDGEEDTVVKILSMMRERNAGGVMAEIGDPKIGARITKKLSYVTDDTEGE